MRLNNDLGLTIVLAEHRLDRVLPFVERLIYLAEGGKSLLNGDARSVLRQINIVPPLVQLGKALAWEPLPLTIKEGLRFSQKLIAVAPAHHPGASPIQRNAPLLQVRGLTVQFGQQTVLESVNLNVWSGEIVVIMGRNGAGKTTLLRSIVGLIKPQRGEVRIEGRSIAERSVAEICRQAAYLPQDPNTLLLRTQYAMRRGSRYAIMDSIKCPAPVSGSMTCWRCLGYRH